MLLLFEIFIFYIFPLAFVVYFLTCQYVEYIGLWSYSHSCLFLVNNLGLTV